MTTITLSKQGATHHSPPAPRSAGLGWAAGAQLQASIDARGRLVLVPSRYEPDDLFRHRPPLERVMSLEEMVQAIAAAVASPDP